MAGRVFVTGASGFVGTAVVEELARRNYSVNALVNRSDLQAAGGLVNAVRGSLFDAKSLDAGMRGCDAVIHLVGIIMEKPGKGVTFQRIHLEGAKNVVDATVRAGIKRYIHMSALGARPDAVSNYHKTKFAAEECVRASSLEWTIFRPSLIHGPKGEFMRMEAKWARMQAPPFLFMPYFGAGPFGCGGAGKLQPVHVDDVARAFVDSLEERQTVREIYLLGGPDEVTWPGMHKIVSKAIVGRERLTIAMPVWKAKLLAQSGFGALAGFNWDQVVMSQENNTCDITKFTDDFGWTPRPFGESVQEYAGQM